MKRLYLIRHAKSSWKDLSLDDFERPLNKRGKRDAPFMSELLKEKNIHPDIIFTSPALRAKSTAEIIAQKLNVLEKIRFDAKIYEAGSSTLESIITNIDDRYNTLFLVGHNPGLNMLAEYYVEFERNIPTCAVLEIGFETSNWRDISATNATLLSFEYPKKYR